MKPAIELLASGLTYAPSQSGVVENEPVARDQPTFDVIEGYFIENLAVRERRDLAAIMSPSAAVPRV